MTLAEELELEDPYALYAGLRDGDGLHQIPDTRIFLVAGHADILEVLARTDDFSNTIQDVLYDVDADSAPAGAAEGAPVDVLATADDPRHAVHRRVVGQAFNARRVAELEPFIRETVERLLVPGLDAGRIEWMGTVALPLPLAVVAHLLGLPGEDQARLQRWSDAGVDVLGAVTSHERMLECSWLIADWAAYHRAQVIALAEEAATVGHAADDLPAAIGAAVRGGDISVDEATSLLVQLVAAGSESTSSLLGSAVRILSERHDLQARLRSEPAAIAPFLEEVLRLESPFRGHYRRVLRDTELAGTRVGPGDRLFVLWGSANRDPEIFTAADDVHLDRANPRQHLAFGNGLHFCIGAPLARLEARLALEAVLGSTSGFVARSRARHLPNLMVRRVSMLPLDLSPAGA